LKTVEMHLSKTYGKLGCNGREGLVEAFSTA
jgi:DNA-binding CsgD family transcriptional regulator